MRVSIIIPSYKRINVLLYTLDNLLNNTNSNNGIVVNIAVGLNKCSGEEETLLKKYYLLFENKNIDFDFISYKENIGKANMLNILFKLFAYKSELVITMDNDIVILKPWLKYINICSDIDYDIIGFSGLRYWAHDPKKDCCPYFEKNGHIYYLPNSIGGGIMLFHREFLEEHKWTNYGGVYGKDDATMCLQTKKKYVLDSLEDWILHDPLRCTTPELVSYENKKIELYKKGITIFPKNWDE